MSETQIGFIGGGNMAASLIGGLVADGWDTNAIHVSDTDSERLAHLHERFSIQTHQDNETTVKSADVLVLAIKPQLMGDIMSPLADAISKKGPLLISIAAGITMTDLSRWCGDYKTIVRSMPNTPALVQSGATGLYADPSVSDDQRALAETVMRAVGLALWVENESQIDAVTAVSGSGPAYFFYIMEIMEQAGIDLGLSPENARLLTLQTAFGASKMALESSDNPAILRQKVTSPGGTTERALSILEQGDLKKLFSQALTGAYERSQELAKILGQKHE
jgi:pyrroline-5-carboxylate reductase